MRVTFDELARDTNSKTPKGQADWFKKHFDVNVEYDDNGVIITHEIFNLILARKYEIPITNAVVASSDRPSKSSTNVVDEVKRFDVEEIIQLIKNTQPQPVQCNFKQAAEMLGISAPTIKKYIMEGKIKLNDAGLIPITEIHRFSWNTKSKKEISHRGDNMLASKFTITEYMKEFGIKSRTTVLKQINSGLINAIDLNKGQAGRSTWRIIIDDEQIEALGNKFTTKGA